MLWPMMYCPIKGTPGGKFGGALPIWGLEINYQKNNKNITIDNN